MVDDWHTSYEWYGAEIPSSEELELLIETISPIDPEMRRMVYELFTYYSSHESRVVVVFEYNFIEEDVSSYQVLPLEIFEKLWKFVTTEHQLWNEVKRIEIVNEKEKPAVETVRADWGEEDGWEEE